MASQVVTNGALELHGSTEQVSCLGNVVSYTAEGLIYDRRV
jgi:hypothetical protein